MSNSSGSRVDYTTTFWAFAIAIVFVTGVSKSGFSSGIEALGVPLLAAFVAPSMAAGILLPLLILADLTNLWSYRKHWQRRYVFLFLPGALVGIGLGALTFSSFNIDVVRLMVGCIALAFSLLFWAKPILPKIGWEMGTKTAIVFGAISGFTSHIAHAGGPPIRAFMLGKTLDKSAFVGTIGYYFCAVNLLKVTPYVAFGQITGDSLLLSAMLIPVALCGVFLGLKLHHRISQRAFQLVSYTFLTIAGLNLVLGSLIRMF